MTRLWRWLVTDRGLQRECFHHNRITGDSWIVSQLINLGAGKMFRCRECGRTWFA